jgi:hypothetical protein
MGIPYPGGMPGGVRHQVLVKPIHLVVTESFGSNFPRWKDASRGPSPLGEGGPKGRMRGSLAAPHLTFGHPLPGERARAKKLSFPGGSPEALGGESGGHFCNPAVIVFLLQFARGILIHNDGDIGMEL